MAHKYSNFTEAFTVLKEQWLYAGANLEYYKSQLNWARFAWDAGNDHGAINALINSGWFLSTLLSMAFDFYEDETDQSCFCESIYYAGKGGDGATVDMDAILNAMLAAEFSEFQMFIGIEDAYRMALWNKPFNAEFYAALGRGFGE